MIISLPLLYTTIRLLTALLPMLTTEATRSTPGLGSGSKTHLPCGLTWTAIRGKLWAS